MRKVALASAAQCGVRILVTNDDGIDSTGLHVLAQRLTQLGDVTVFAPSGEYSGAGAAIGHLGAGVPDIHRVDRAEMPDVAACYHIDGPPALASLLACRGILGELPDVVMSGINPGWNVGHAVHFSGTVGAGITASIYGIGAVATSQPTAGDRQHWQTAADAAADLVADVVATPRLLNLNVPNVASHEVLGTKRTLLSNRIPYSLHSPTMTEHEPGVFAVGFERNGPFDSFDGSDTHAVQNRYLSITELAPCHAK